MNRIAVAAAGIALAVIMNGIGVAEDANGLRAAERQLLDAKTSDFSSTYTLAASRAAFLADRRDVAIGTKLAGPLDAEAIKDWPGIMWGAGLINDRGREVRGATRQMLAAYAGKPEGFQRAALGAAYSLFPGEFDAEVAALLPQIESPREFATAGYLLLLAGREPKVIAAIRTGMEARFPAWQKEPRLVALEHRLSHDPAVELAKRPPLADLLTYEMRSGFPVVFSIQRQDRRHAGIAIVRGPDGRFVRREDGTIFQIAQLAMARTDLPGTITFGNSPQGVYTIRGTGLATNQHIGTVPYLWSRLPIEAPVADFLHDATAEAPEWSEEFYLSLLPPSWRGYFPISEAWLAGRAGRSEIIVHGTTIDPEFYVGEAYYPNTPSAGCLCAKEFWNPEDGRLVYSDQLALLKAFLSGGKRNGYLVVVELDDRAAPVTLDEVIPTIIATGQ